MKTILFSFADSDDRDKFLSIIKDATETMISYAAKSEEESAAVTKEFISSVLNTIKLDPPIKEDHERSVAIFVSGTKLYEGQMAEMSKVFNQEAASHTASVVMKELRGGEWVEIRARRQV